MGSFEGFGDQRVAWKEIFLSMKMGMVVMLMCEPEGIDQTCHQKGGDYRIPYEHRMAYSKNYSVSYNLSFLLLCSYLSISVFRHQKFGKIVEMR